MMMAVEPPAIFGQVLSRPVIELTSFVAFFLKGEVWQIVTKGDVPRVALGDFGESRMMEERQSPAVLSNQCNINIYIEYLWNI